MSLFLLFIFNFMSFFLIFFLFPSLASKSSGGSRRGVGGREGKQR